MRGLHAALARIYKETGHADWATVEEQRERRLGPPDCLREALACAFAAGKHREVVATATASKAPDAPYWLARAYSELATQAFGRLTSLPPSVHSWEWTARQSREQRRYVESADQWRNAIALAPEEARFRTELAITLRLQRDLPGAQRALEESLKLDPAAPDANYFLGDVLLAQSQPARAIPFLEASLRADAQAPHTQGALGRAYALTGRPGDAIPHLKQSLESDVDGSLRLQLGRAYQATGQAELARAALEDYEEFRKAAPPGAPEDPAAAITAPRY